MVKELEEKTGNADLASEIRIFVPEIMAKLTLGYQEGDSLFFIDGENNIEFKKTQLRSYFYIQQTVIEYLNTMPPQEHVQNIVRGSVAYRELRNVVLSAKEKAEQEGKTSELSPKDMYVPGTAYRVTSQGYRAW